MVVFQGLSSVPHLMRYRVQEMAVLGCRVPSATSCPGLGRGVCVQARRLGVASRLHFTVRAAASKAFPGQLPSRASEHVVCACVL